MKIRKFRKSDLNKIMEFKRKSVKMSFPDNKMNEKMLIKKLISYSIKQPEGIKIVEEDGKIVGYIWFGIEKNYLGRYGLLHHIFVDRKYRKQGLAKKLMQMAERYFKTKGIKKIKVTISLNNVPSLRMFKKWDIIKPGL